VQDDGSGFDPFLQRRQNNGMGLQIMRYRADIIGGVLAIESRKAAERASGARFQSCAGRTAGRDMIGSVPEGQYGG